MAEFSSVTLFYTANLAGKLDLLPRLSTVIQRERQTAEGPALLLDLGDTCSAESWICQATQGRAPFLVLDAMGYDAALIGGPEQVPIPLASLRRLLDTIVMPLVVWNRVREVTKRGISFLIAPGDAKPPEAGPVIRIDRATDTLPGSANTRLVLGDVAQGSLARVEMAWPEWTVRGARHVAIAPDVPPDPTIAAVVELVESEARYYAPQQGGTI